LTNQPKEEASFMEESMNFIKLNNRIFRNTQIYLDRVLKKYELSSGSYYYLFILEKNEGISQNKISNIIGNDKAMSARTITKLIELDYVYKKEDECDGRAYNLYLTSKAKKIAPEIHNEIEKLISLVTVDLSEEEKEITKSSLAKVLKVAQKLNEHGGI
jgi:DNA-binding MarR family transcriptional regulator